MSDTQCIDCGVDCLKQMNPPYSKRVSMGVPMTRTEAKFLFYTSYGNRCLDCMKKHNELELSKLMARHRNDPSIRTRPWPDFGGVWKEKPMPV